MFTEIKNGVKNVVDNKVKKGVKALLDKTTVDEKIVGGVRHLHKEYKKNMVTALSAALAFVMALYIRDLVKSWISWILSVLEISEGTGLIYQTIIALVVLTICVLGIVLLSRWNSEKK